MKKKQICWLSPVPRLVSSILTCEFNFIVRHILCKYLDGQLDITKIDITEILTVITLKNIVKKLMDKQVFILIPGIVGETTSGG